ncbi:DUF7344 domain-containing protein [Natrinema soli]|uniref:DUF7344 domain-containing protein n=1 Tax=Natrinema soli TaxID=1930624 RepID=A0ABD5SJE0_9EURY
MKYADIMKPHTQTPQDTETGTPNISNTELFAAFAAERRQYALTYLAQKPAAIHLGDLAEYISLKENNPSYDWYQRVLVDLHHQHLPYLCDVGLVHYEEETELLELAVDRDVVSPFLELIEHAE